MDVNFNLSPGKKIMLMNLCPRTLNYTDTGNYFNLNIYPRSVFVHVDFIIETFLTSISRIRSIKLIMPDSARNPV